MSSIVVFKVVFKCMSLLKYFRPVDGLPDPRGSLSATMSRETIAATNQEVQKELAPRKRGKYKQYTSAQRFSIGKYSCVHGASAAARHFSKRWGCNVSDSTVKSIKMAYLEEVRKRPRSDDGEEVTALPAKKRGRKLFLGEDLDRKVQVYLRKVREGGGAVSSRIVMAAARGILLKCNPSLLAQNGGPITLSKCWAQSLMTRMNFVQRKATTSESKNSLLDFDTEEEGRIS